MNKKWTWERLYETPGTFSLVLSPGTYTVSMRGAGGAGGEDAPPRSGHADGVGGAGGTAKLVIQNIEITENTVAEVYVGTGGLTKTNGGNGGNGGSGGNNTDGGAGGGGGYPTYIKLGQTFISSAGAGGGGGGGGNTVQGRNGPAACGGGGGGLYKLITTPLAANETNKSITFYLQDSTTTIGITTEPQQLSMGLTIPFKTPIAVGDTFNNGGNPTTGIGLLELTVDTIDGNDVTFSGTITALTITYPVATTVYSMLGTPANNIVNIPGIKGALGGGNNDNNGKDGIAGNVTDFPNITSGQGGRGGTSDDARGRGGASANGGGASGGGGGAGGGNHSSAFAGGGGGGAGGDLDASGGHAGYGRGSYGAATDGYNYHATPTPSTDYQGNPTNLGCGGEPNQNGYSGWLYIVRIDGQVLDCGLVTETVTNTIDCGAVDGAVTETIDTGTI